MSEGINPYNPESDKPSEFLGNWADGSVAKQEEAKLEESSMPNSYKPSDVIQQYGPNKGNIKDIELARIAAQAEEDKRIELGSGAKPDYVKSLSEVAGDQAIYTEIAKRADAASGGNLEDWEKLHAAKEVAIEQAKKRGRDIEFKHPKG